MGWGLLLPALTRGPRLKINCQWARDWTVPLGGDRAAEPRPSPGAPATGCVPSAHLSQAQAGHRAMLTQLVGVLTSSGCCDKTLWTAWVQQQTSHSSGGWRARVKVLAAWFPVRALVLAFRWPPSCCPHMGRGKASSLCLFLCGN